MTSIDEVMSQFDRANKAFCFPDLNNGHYYAIDARLSVFADERRWAVVVETVGYCPRAGNVHDVLHHFGNCIRGSEAVFESEDLIERVDNMEQIEHQEIGETFTGHSPVVVRGAGFACHMPMGTDLQHVFRAMLPEARELLLADADELRRRVPHDLPLILQLDEWHHPDVHVTRPSASETFRLVAAVAALADPSLYSPTMEPNTHWSNWPESGTL